MLGWLWRMVVGRLHQCRHVWKIRDEGVLDRKYASGRERLGVPFAVLQCEKCGDLKAWDFEK